VKQTFHVRETDVSPPRRLTGRPSPGWLILLAQLPAKPSSPRVALWRRLRSIGATQLVNGAWVLPRMPSHATFFGRLVETVRRQGGTGFLLTAAASPDTDPVIVERFRADRGREYAELIDCCDDFLAEIDKETRAAKFTFAELEESEQSLERLTGWLGRIQARDFFPDQRWTQAVEILERCRDALARFSRAVYAEEAQTPLDDAVSPSPFAGEGQGGGSVPDRDA
jgi:hypothetical protein